LIQSNKPDIAFLDIKMPEMSGFEVARQVGNMCKVVFVTAYDNYAVRAFESNAIDYLLKPVSDERLQKCLARINDYIRKNDHQMEKINAIYQDIFESREISTQKLTWINVSTNNITKMISVDDIVYFFSEDKYTVVNTVDNSKFLINKPVKDLENELDTDTFWRIHRGTIVNANYIDYIVRDRSGNPQLKLKNGKQTLKVSRSHAKRFKQI